MANASDPIYSEYLRGYTARLSGANVIERVFNPTLDEAKLVALALGSLDGAKQEEPRTKGEILATVSRMTGSRVAPASGE